MDFFPGLLLEFLKKIGKAVSRAIVLVEFEFHRDAIFRHVEDSFRRLARFAASQHSFEDDSTPSVGKSLAEWLYCEESAVPAVKGVPDFLSIHTLPDRLREVRFIA